MHIVDNANISRAERRNSKMIWLYSTAYMYDIATKMNAVQRLMNITNNLRLGCAHKAIQSNRVSRFSFLPLCTVFKGLFRIYLLLHHMSVTINSGRKQSPSISIQRSYNYLFCL